MSKTVTITINVTPDLKSKIKLAANRYTDGSISAFMVALARGATNGGLEGLWVDQWRAAYAR